MHIHTEFSDGTYSPEEVAKIAKEKGLTLISVCDHDTIEAYERLRPACAAEGITLVQGVEMSADWAGITLHILAYSFDPNNPKLLELLNSTQREFEWEGRQCIKNLAKDYPQISLDEYSRYKKPAGRGGWNSVNYIYDKGLAKSVFDAFKFHDTYGTPMKFSNAALVCSTIIQAGGIPVLAHPGNYWRLEELEEKLSLLLPVGIGGIECFHPGPRHTDEFNAKCVEFCKAHNLCITCGGDSHGDFAQSWRGIGCLKIDSSQLNLTGILV